MITMNLQTNVSIPKPEGPLLNYDSSIFLLGSCFSRNIGDQLNYFKFKSAQNPFGILFHPMAIENLIQKSMEEYSYSEKDIDLKNEVFFSFDAHSNLNGLDKQSVISNLNEALAKTRNLIMEASHIFITLGTAWVYRHLNTDKIVANCHKVPQKEFQKELLSVREIKDSLLNIIQLIQSVSPNCKIIFTVSPIRHVKNGLAENNRSKAHLIAAVHEVFGMQEQAFYFPSYEIQMDELRDYRFYDEDLIHPNKIAIQYIWERFQECWIDPSMKSILNEVDSIQKGLHHKTFNENSKAHQDFKLKLEQRIKDLQKRFSHIHFSPAITA